MATGASSGDPVLIGKNVIDYTSLAYENAMRLANLRCITFSCLLNRTISPN